MHGTLVKCDEVQRFIGRIEEPVTKNLVNMAFVHLVKEVHVKQRRPATDLDVLFLAKAMKEFFAEHAVIARALEGERVGALFEADG